MTNIELELFEELLEIFDEDEIENLFEMMHDDMRLEGFDDIEPLSIDYRPNGIIEVTYRGNDGFDVSDDYVIKLTPDEL